MHIRDLQKSAYENSRAHGFHDDPTSENVPTKIALIHEEASEALAEHRAGRMALWFDVPFVGNGGGKPEGFGVELADIVIRVADLAESLGIDLEHMIELKHMYNVSRPYKHGKAY
jgi:NTP pyrophosphatase (non-canonical NTP hydrolase)